VVATMQDCPDARLQEVSEAMVRHLHGFVKVVFHFSNIGPEP
jgi:hypothetical protein